MPLLGCGECKFFFSFYGLVVAACYYSSHFTDRALPEANDPERHEFAALLAHLHRGIPVQSRSPPKHPMLKTGSVLPT